MISRGPKEIFILHLGVLKPASSKKKGNLNFEID